MTEGEVKPVFAWPVRVYWEDTDAGGVVYHSNYLRFLERARSEWLRAAGIGQQQLQHEAGIVFVVHRMDLRFRRPARLDDLLTATVAPVDVRGARFSVAQRLLREPDRELLVEAEVHIACLDAASFRPRPIPDDILQEIATR
ncbi:tol-pal system-associated acyl-CoA thioesterase [Dokdonella koreensis]|uniref:tol-pal system-associated acyl-CoA thioesterase n=1 Tax=Dokdonella koreensis TaxID=323415 RepID=UPI00082C9A08|nr:tol-pal system-associated acyl-CoA thioesterase [Dokdonella koreensis]